MIDFSVDPYTHTYALVGDRLHDSWLTVLHNTLFNAAQCNAICVPLHCSGERALDMLSLLGDGISGMFVTGNMMGLASSWAELNDADSRALGLADLLSIDAKGRVCAHNTLVGALTAAIRENWIDVQSDAPTLIIGSGRMARICAYTLLQEGAEVMVSARNAAAAAQLQADIETATGQELQLCALGEEHGEYSLVVNATLFGCASMAHRDMGHSSPIPDELLERCGAVLECVPTPVQTELLARAAARSLKTVNALDIQLNSAFAAQQLLGIRQLPRKVSKPLITELRSSLRDAR